MHPNGIENSGSSAATITFNSERLTWSCVVVRALLWVLPGALSLRILTVADVLLPLWHPKRQSLHDLAARTQVVRLR